MPVAQITAMTPVAKALGPNRIVRGQGIMYPVGDVALPAGEERELRRRLVQQALEALSTEPTHCQA